MLEICRWRQEASMRHLASPRRVVEKLPSNDGILLHLQILVCHKQSNIGRRECRIWVPRKWATFSEFLRALSYFHAAKVDATGLNDGAAFLPADVSSRRSLGPIGSVLPPAL